MLRFSLLVLLLANAGYLAWSQGWMATLGWAPEVQSEPQRLRQQVRPDVLSVVAPSTPATPPPAAPAPLVATAPVDPLAPVEPVAPVVATAPAEPSAPLEEVLPQPTVCLQSESMDAAQSQALQRSLKASELPAASWEMLSTSTTGRWMVYLGKFANEMALEKRRAELRSRKIAYDRAGGTLDLGLSLGRFASEEAATRELSNMLKQGVRGARVVQERAPQTLYSLRLPQATAAQRQMLQALQGKALQPCAAP